MKKIIQSMHVSLDGFTTDREGAMNWIHVDDEIFDYTGFITEQADTGLYGRNTFQMMEAYWPTAAEQPNASRHDKQHSAWYKAAKKVVLSTTMKDAPPNTQIISNDLVAQIQKLKAQPGKNMVVFGSPGAAHSLMEHNLIDEYWLFVNPVLLGAGKPLFQNVNTKTQLEHLETKTFTSGVVGLHYKLK